MADERRVLIVSSIPPKRADVQGPQWSDLTDLTWAVMKKYCDKWGYAFHGDVSDVYLPIASPELFRSLTVAQAPIRYMVKFKLMQHFLTPENCGETFDFIAWVDADCLVTNFDLPITKWCSNGRASTGDDAPLLGDLLLCWDQNSLHPTVIIARATTLMRGLMWELAGIGWRLFGTQEWVDNFALRFAISTPPYQQAVWWASAKDVCAQHPGLYPMPKDVAAMCEWTPESWSLHLSALPIAHRIKLAREYIDRLGLLS